MRELTCSDLPGVVGSSVLNLIRRGADGSLRLSADRWQLASIDERAVVFRSQPQAPGDAQQPLEVHLERLERITWDRLPKQQRRSQLRFHLRGGELWTFSGMLTEPTD